VATLCWGVEVEHAQNFHAFFADGVLLDDTPCGGSLGARRLRHEARAGEWPCPAAWGQWGIRGNVNAIAEHRPRSHQAHLEWTPSRMVHWAQSIGPHTASLFERILPDKPHPEMGYRSCLGIIRLAGQYSPTRMEAAAVA
jgi:hypothetical protein